MKRSYASPLLYGAGFWILSSVCFSGTPQAWVPADWGKVTLIAPRPDLVGAYQARGESPILRSPDGKKALYTKFRYDFDSDQIEVTLNVVEIERLRSGPDLAADRSGIVRSLHIANKYAGPSGNFFASLQWSSDSSVVTYGLYRSAGAITADYYRWNPSKDGGSVWVGRGAAIRIAAGSRAALAEVPPPADCRDANSDGYRYSLNKKPPPAWTPQVEAWTSGGKYALGSDVRFDRLAISPSGAYAIAVSDSSDHGDRISMLDLQKRTTQQLGDLLPADATNVTFFWEEVERHGIVAFSRGMNSHVSSFAVVEAGVNDDWKAELAYGDVPLGQIDGGRLILAGGRLSLTVFSKGVEGKIEIVKEEGQWRAKVSGPPLTRAREGNLDAATFYLEQSAVLPPRLVATAAGQKYVIDGADFSKVKVRVPARFSWYENGTGPFNGALYLPEKPAPSLPLVVQIYDDFPELFLPDGPHAGTSDCAQSLVGAGFAVLQISGWLDRTPGLRTPLSEGADLVLRIDSAVSALAKDRIVDPSKVGITGFSRGGYLVYYAITHPGRIQLRAAVCDDSYKGGYADYLTRGIVHGQWLPQLAQGDERLYGGAFWQAKARWLAEETSFNVDRVAAATLFVSHDETSAERDRLTVGAFMLCQKPVEHLFFANESHVLMRPKNRLAMSQVIVDWMRFWVLGEEDSLPKNREQWQRWRDLIPATLTNPQSRQQGIVTRR